jgi:hypothetical protein
MTDRWMDRLSEYLDGELTEPERREMEQHLFGCASCASALEELRNVVERARRLPPRPPEQDLWPAIAERIGAAPEARSSSTPHGSRSLTADVVDLGARRSARWRGASFSLPQLAAASLVLSLISGGAVYLLRKGDETGTAPIAIAPQAAPQPGVGPGSPGGTPTGAALPAGFAERQYDAAVLDLQRALEQGRGRLSPETVRVLERNLKTIDTAISEARSALAADPGNVYLNDHLARTMRKKLDLLRQANAIAAAT